MHGGHDFRPTVSFCFGSRWDGLETWVKVAQGNVSHIHSARHAYPFAGHAIHLRVSALGYARTEVNISPYLFSYILSHGFPTPQAPDKETESIFTIAATYSLRFPIIRYSGGVPTQKKDLCK
jgi:hypothetical protein